MAEPPCPYGSIRGGAWPKRRSQGPVNLAGQMPGGSLLLLTAAAAVLLLSCPPGPVEAWGHVELGQPGPLQGCCGGRGIARKVLLQVEPQTAESPGQQEGSLTGTILACCLYIFNSIAFLAQNGLQVAFYLLNIFPCMIMSSIRICRTWCACSMLVAVSPNKIKPEFLTFCF